jgi:hypothetical protein
MADWVDELVEAHVAARMAPGGEVHWLTRYDPTDGEPYGELCWCTATDGQNHDADGEITGLSRLLVQWQGGVG